MRLIQLSEDEAVTKCSKCTKTAKCTKNCTKGLAIFSELTRALSGKGPLLPLLEAARITPVYAPVSWFKMVPEI